MKVLLYKSENLEAIAEATGRSLEDVQDTYEDSLRLDFPVYSVIDYVHFGSGLHNPNVTYVSASLIKEHYNFGSPERIGEYTTVLVKP